MNNKTSLFLLLAIILPLTLFAQKSKTSKHFEGFLEQEASFRFFDTNGDRMFELEKGYLQLKGTKAKFYYQNGNYRRQYLNSDKNTNGIEYALFIASENKNYVKYHNNDTIYWLPCAGNPNDLDFRVVNDNLTTDYLDLSCKVLNTSFYKKDTIIYDDGTTENIYELIEEKHYYHPQYSLDPNLVECPYEFMDQIADITRAMLLYYEKRATYFYGDHFLKSRNPKGERYSLLKVNTVKVKRKKLSKKLFEIDPNAPLKQYR